MGGHRAPSTRPAPGEDSVMVLPPRHSLSLPWRAPLCPGPSLWPCPGDRAQPCSWQPPAPGVFVAAGAGTNTPGDGPALTVPCHQGPQPGARRVWRSAGDWGRCQGQGRAPPVPSSVPTFPGHRRSSAGTAPCPEPPAGTGSTQVPARAEPELLRTGSPSPRGRGQKVTRRNEGEPLRAESPRGGERGGSRAAPTLHRPVQKVGGGRKNKLITIKNKIKIKK